MNDFTSYCMSENLKEMETLYDSSEEIRSKISENNNVLFRNMCLMGCLDSVKWLHDKITQPSNANYDDIFEMSLYSENLNICDYLLETHGFLFENIKEYFNIAFDTNNLKIIKYINSKANDISLFTPEIFQKITTKGTLQICEYFLEQNPSFDILMDFDFGNINIPIAPDLLVFLKRIKIQFSDEQIKKFLFLLLKEDFYDVILNTFMTLYDISYHVFDYMMERYCSNTQYSQKAFTCFKIMICETGDKYDDVIAPEKYLKLSSQVDNAHIFEYVYEHMGSSTYFDIMKNDHAFFKQMCNEKKEKMCKMLVSKFNSTYKFENINSCYVPIILKNLKRIRIKTDDICVVCHCSNNDCVANCSHSFCYNCLNIIYKTSKSCPLCKGRIEKCYVKDL